MQLNFSQPSSIRGAGTVRHWVAVSLSSAQCRIHVSARDGEIPASCRPGAGSFLCAPLRTEPLNALASPAQTAAGPHPPVTAHSSIQPCHRPASAAISRAGDPPSLHRPAAAAGLPPPLRDRSKHFKVFQSISKRFKAFQRYLKKNLILNEQLCISPNAMNSLDFTFKRAPSIGRLTAVGSRCVAAVLNAPLRLFKPN